MRRIATPALAGYPRFVVRLLCLLSLLGGLSSPRAQAQVSQGLVPDSTEARVLHQLYLSTGGDQWSNRTNWPTSQTWPAAPTSADFATWAGVGVRNGDVISLDRNISNLQGTLPSSLGQLTELQSLVLPNNPGLTGPLPATLGQLQKLTYLQTTRSQLGGPLPRMLTQLPQLRYLYLDAGLFSGPLPAWLGDFPSLEELSLGGNRFTGPIPPELSKLTRLRFLALSNDYAMVPGEGNVLTGAIPPELGQLTNLTYLDFSMNPLTGAIPPELGQLTNLTFLELDGCLLSGAVPAAVTGLPRLRQLILGLQPYPYYRNYNRFTSLPAPSSFAHIATTRLLANDNAFDFGQLEPYFASPGQLLTAPGSTYLFQFPAALPRDTQQVVANAAVHLDGTLAGTRNVYQWQRYLGGQWLDLPGQTQPVLTLSAVTTAHTGRYRARVTNTVVTGQVLYSREVLLDVLPYPAKTRNLPVDTTPAAALAAYPVPPAPPTDAPGDSLRRDLNYVRSWVPRVAITQAPAVVQSPAAQLAAQAPVGSVRYERWAPVPGPAGLDALPLSSPPTATQLLSTFEAPTGQGDNYGARLRGYLLPPVSGAYSFWLSGDDVAQLWLSADEDPAHARLLAALPSYTGAREWTKYSQQASGPVTLVAGHRYYVEVRHHQDGGGDGVALTWRRPDEPATAAPGEPIAGTYLAAAAATAPSLPVNWVANPSFEADGQSVASPQGWLVATGAGTEANASYCEDYGKGFTGYQHGTHYRPQAYEVYTYQTLTGLPGGRYTVRAWLRSNDGASRSVLRARGYGGADRQVGLPAGTTGWVQLELPDVLVSNGQLEVGVYSHADGGQAIHFDDVSVLAQAAPTSTSQAVPLANAGFEADGQGVASPQGWQVTPGPGSYANASYSETYPGAHGGNFHGTHYRPEAYEVATTQTLTGLPAGTYAVRAWLRSPDAAPAGVLRARGYGGADRQVGLPAGATGWVQVELSNLQVTTGQLELGVYSRAQAGQATYFDDVTLTRLVPLPAAAGPSALGWAVDSASVTTQYLDGLGRPVQTVQHQASPRRHDLVQAQTYDGLGREVYQLLPFAADTAGTGRLGYHRGALGAQAAYYAPDNTSNPPAPGDLRRGVARSGVAYAQTQFEASPLNRVLTQAAPGEAWQLLAHHGSERRERPNTAQDSVPSLHPGYDPRSLDPGYQGVYPAGELWGVISSEPQRPDLPGETGTQTIEWKDKLGQVVCKQVEVARTGSVSAGLHSRWLRTAYAYDDFGHLRFVVQPEGVKRLFAPALAQPQPPTAAELAARATRAGLRQGLQVYLPLDEAAGTVATDSSGQGRAGQLSVSGGQAQWLPQGGHDGLGGALHLTGGAQLTVPLSWQPTRFTVAFWQRADRVFDYSQQMGAGQGWGAFLFHSASDGSVYVGTDVASRLASMLTSSAPVQVGQWQHFVFTFDQGQAALYRDGQLLASRSDMHPVSQPWQNFVLGISGDQAYDDVRVYDRALTADEVRALSTPIVAPAPVSSVADFLFHYRYDGRGRQIAKQVPGQAGETLVVYDQLDRPVLSQDAQQRTRREWSYSKYDALGRVVLTGLVTRQDTLGQVSLQAQAAADTTAGSQYEQRTANAAFAQHYTTNQAFPRLGQQGFGPGLVLTASYFDDYDFDNDGQADADAHYTTGADAAFAAGTAPVADEARVTGLSTRTLTRVLNRPSTDPGAEWLQATSFYDERGRLVQTQSSNARGGQDVVTLQLDFLGKPLRSVTRHQGPSLATPLQVVETMRYDHAERLLTTSQQLPSEATAAPLSRRVYNELGQLLVDTLASGRLRQAIKYAYNIRGWLTSLNDPAQPAAGDLFNLSLHYETGFTSGYEQYNGNLTGQTWRGRDGVQRAYGYVYDPVNRLLQGDFVARSGAAAGTPSAGAPWQQELDHYRLSFVSYDDNGNINTLRRQGLLQAATHNRAQVFGAVDNLTYSYQGNRLQAVQDQVSGNQRPQPASYHGAPTSLAGDFQEAGVHQSQEYQYDANGNLTADQNKHITGIAYNHLNLPRQIHFGQVGDSVVFRYTASGQKVAKLVYQTGKPLQRTDYLGPYQYEQDSLRFFPHAAGRVLRFVSYDAAHQPTVSYQREFTVKDHLGNLRLAYRAGQVRTLLATLEQDSATHKRESQQFDSLSVSVPIAVATPYSYGGGSWAARLNAGTAHGAPQPLGPLTQLGVQQGDTVTVTAYGMYPQAQPHGFFFSLAAFLANLVHPAQAPPPGLEAGRRRNLPLLQVGVAAGLGTLTQASGGVPLGYLRVLVFDKDSALVAQPVRQLTQAANGGYEQLRLQVFVPQDGYVTAYVGNESDVDVFFDEVSVEHRPGLQVQETQYDPAGLELAGLAAPSPGIQGLNNYRFNGKEFQADLGLNWNHQDWRFFDPQLLRWHSVDPEVENGQESWTPYSFSYDNAVRYSDADGRCPCEGEGPTVAGLIYNTVAGTAVSLVNASIKITPGADFVTRTVFGGDFRASVDGQGGVSYGIRPTATDVRGTLVNEGSDLIDLGAGVLTVLSGGASSTASHALPMGAGLLLEQGAGKVAQNEAVQAGKQSLNTELKEFVGTAPRMARGATPNSKYTHLNAQGKAQNNYIYNENGDLHGEVNFAAHGEGTSSGHGHIMDVPGEPGTGHGKGKHIHHDDPRLPKEWQSLPNGIEPNLPIGSKR